MKTRIISGVVIAVICIALCLIGGPLLGIVLMACSMIGFYELSRALGVHSSEGGWGNDQDKDPVNDHSFRFNALEVVGWTGTALYYAVLIYMSIHSGAAEAAALKNTLQGVSDGVRENIFLQHANMATLTAVFGVFFTVMGLYVLTFPKYNARQVICAFFSFLYCPVMLSFVYRSIFLPYGRFVYVLIFFSSWICDTCAYAVGMLFGKHRLAPVLSPKKSIEGAIGGVAGSAVFCALAALVLRYLHPGEQLAGAFVIIGIAGSVISQIGDLAASAIKRNRGIKDYGRIIPGHGGIMDRFDSVIFTAPMIYGLAVLFLILLR